MKGLITRNECIQPRFHPCSELKPSCASSYIYMMTYSPKRIFLSRICCKTTCFNNMRNNLAIYKCFVYSWPIMDNSSTNSVEQFANKFMATTNAQLHVAWIVLVVGIINYQNILTHSIHNHCTRNY
jgi:hypothetical protein